MSDEQGKCPKCGRAGVVTSIGTASKRRYMRCTDSDNCGATWQEKNAAAVTLGRLGGMARAASTTAQQREAIAKSGAVAAEAKRVRVRAR